MKNQKMYEADDKMISLIRDNYDLLQSLGSFRISLYWAKIREIFYSCIVSDNFCIVSDLDLCKILYNFAV